MQDEDLKKYLCDQEIAQIDSLTQICRSLIIRDEEITKLSLELLESERFEFVRSALGTIDFSDIKKKAEKVLLYFKEATTNWQEINYHMRGDVRRFLSFKIGDELNPSFIFSSGQSRAAGLAFLLAIHLSRRWCLLDTLVLDDPVQHIDDFRALNLVEVLAAIRKSGRQIICTVEDEALADLLCRKLRSTENNEGCHIKMDYHVNKGAFVSSIEHIRPMSSQILLSA